MIIAIGQLYGAAARSQELRALLLEHAERSARAPGCRRFDVAAALDDPHHYVLNQEWDDAAAFEDYTRSPAFHDFGRRLLGLLTREWQLRVYRVDDAVAVEDIVPMDPRRAD